MESAAAPHSHSHPLAWHSAGGILIVWSAHAFTIAISKAHLVIYRSATNTWAIIVYPYPLGDPPQDKFNRIVYGGNPTLVLLGQPSDRGAVAWLPPNPRTWSLHTPVEEAMGLPDGVIFVNEDSFEGICNIDVTTTQARREAVAKWVLDAS